MSKKPQLSLLTIGVSVATLLLSAPTFAGTAYKGENYKGEAMPPCPVECMLKDGFYVGAQVGYDMYRIRDDVDALVGETFVDSDPALNANGWAGGLFLGYGKYFDNFYLGAEIFANAAGAKSDWDTDVLLEDGSTASLDHDMKVRSEYGISLLPGVKINNCALFYLRAGYNWAKIKFDADATYTDIDTGIPVTADSDKSKTVHGWSGGLGIETVLADNWSVRTEYTYTSYNKLNNDDDDDATGTASDADLKISDNQFMLSLIYHIS